MMSIIVFQNKKLVCMNLVSGFLPLSMRTHCPHVNVRETLEELPSGVNVKVNGECQSGFPGKMNYDSFIIILEKTFCCCQAAWTT